MLAHGLRELWGLWRKHWDRKAKKSKTASPSRWDAVCMQELSTTALAEIRVWLEGMWQGYQKVSTILGNFLIDGSCVFSSLFKGFAKGLHIHVGTKQCLNSSRSPAKQQWKLPHSLTSTLPSSYLYSTFSSLSFYFLICIIRITLAASNQNPHLSTQSLQIKDSLLAGNMIHTESKEKEAVDLHGLEPRTEYR